MKPRSLMLLSLTLCSTCAMADEISSQGESRGFLEDGSAHILSRTLYMNSDARRGGFYSSRGGEKEHGYAEDLGTSIFAKYTSGYTQGTIGFGLDLTGMAAFKLDSGAGRYADGVNGLFPGGHNGRPQDEYTKMNVALKARISKTELKIGQMQVETPVFATNDDRLLPEDATGALVQSNEIEDLTLVGGYFTALRGQEYTYHDSVHQDSLFDDEGKTLKRIYFGGAEYQFTENLSGSLYASHNKDFWRKLYTNLNYKYAFNDDNELNLDFNWYRTKSTGKGYGDDRRADDSNRRIDSDLWSLASAYRWQAHTFMLAYQRNSGTGGLGRTAFPYDVDGGGAIAVANSVQYSDFNFENQTSWQARYMLDMAHYGIPGLTFTTLYVKGTGATNENDNNRHNGKAWERDLEVAYEIQNGPAKGLNLRLMQARYRSNFGGSNEYALNGWRSDNGRDNVDETRFIVEYPLDF